jgi:ADP-L-glycero-D-manno-heptose 6-epimerase
VAQAFVDRKIRSSSDDMIATVEMPDELVNSFQFYTRANQLLPQIAEKVKGNDVKMKKYINQLLDQHYGNG